MADDIFEDEKGNWYRTDETQEAIESLMMVESKLSTVSENLYDWKWVIIALHNSLQGFMVLALRGTNSLAVLTKKSAEEWLRAYENGLKPVSNARLDTYLNLYKKVQSDHMMQFDISQQLEPTAKQSWSVKKLNSLRNTFIHFQPQGFSLEVSGMPGIVENCLNIIWFLSFESGNVLWHDEAQEEKTQDLIRKSKEKLTIIKKLYNEERDRKIS